jgi:hypothetical protein
LRGRILSVSGQIAVRFKHAYLLIIPLIHSTGAIERLKQSRNPLSGDFASELEASDDHFKLYGMRAEDFKYLDETCPTCENRIDQLGWCGHGNMGGD